MVSSFVARVAASMLLHHAYDEQLILKKGHAFLDAELPEGLSGSLALEMLQRVPEEAHGAL